MHPFTWIFLAALAARLAVQLWLAGRHARFLAAHRDRVPAAFQGVVSPQEHRRAADYNRDKARLGMLEDIFASAVLLAWTLGGGLQALDQAWAGFGWGPVGHGTAVLISAFVIMGALELPLNAYHTFVLESRYGFNRTTPATFAADTVKQLFLLLALGTPVAALVLWLMAQSGALWWLWVWGVWSGFSLFVAWAWPTLIAPLFNKFTPLADQALRERIERLLARTGFSSNGVFVMDGSRRSAHGNAYFTGFGRHKRIVFFDTLLKGLAPQEVEAVLAHELGHFKRRHVIKRIAWMFAMSLAGLALLGWLNQQPWFFTALGVERPADHLALLLFLFVVPVFGFFVTPFLAWASRRHEFEADRFAAETVDARSLIAALVKLYRENAASLVRDPWYSRFYDSHPPPAERIGRLERWGAAPGTTA